MRLLDEWRFHFTVETPEPVPHAVVADGSLLDVCVGWAEENGFFIGGGIGPAVGVVGGVCNCWSADFGFYTQQDGSLTPESDAARLWAVIAHWCSQRGYRLTGGFDAFPPGWCENP